MEAIENLRKLRTSTLEAVSALSPEELNKIPAGFSNNIIWNIGHMVATQQGLCYSRSGLPRIVEDSYFERYKPGSKPEGPVSQEEVEEIKVLLFSTLDQLEKDYNDGIFKEYPSFVTRYGVPLSSIEEAINFLPFHDGFHLGYLLALKRML